MAVSFYNTLNSIILKNQQQGIFSCFQATSDSIPSKVVLTNTLGNPHQANDIESFVYDTKTGLFTPVPFSSNGTIIFTQRIKAELQCDFFLVTFKKEGIYRFDYTVVDEKTFAPLFTSTQVITVLE